MASAVLYEYAVSAAVDMRRLRLMPIEATVMSIWPEEEEDTIDLSVGLPKTLIVE